MKFYLSAAILTLLLHLGTAVAQSHPDFSGTWKLDRAASESTDDMMKAQGLPWIIRRAAAGLEVTQRIFQTGDSLRVMVMTSVKNRDDTMQIGGPWEDRVTEESGPIKTRTLWDEGGKGLITAVKFKLKKDGTPAEIITTRTLIDEGKTQLQLVELKCSDGRNFKAKRIFRRAS